jgi:hypothetical protein
MELKIAPVHDAIKDFRHNIRWIVSIAGIWLVYVLISSTVIMIWENWSYLNSCYFTLINMTTVGFGDIVPTTWQGKFIAGINSVVGLILFGAFVASITMALQPSSFSGSAHLVSSPDTGDDNEVETADEDKAKEFLQGLNSLISIARKHEGNEMSEDPRKMDIFIEMDIDGREQYKFVHMHVRVRRG